MLVDVILILLAFIIVGLVILIIKQRKKKAVDPEMIKRNLENKVNQGQLETIKKQQVVKKKPMDFVKLINPVVWFFGFALGFLVTNITEAGIIIKIVFLVVGIGVGYILYSILLMRNKGLALMTKAVKSKSPIIFLETPTGVYLRRVVKTFQNIAITNNKEIVIMTGSSLKNCFELAIPVSHGDLYRSITIPQELRITIQQLKDKGWTEKQIGEFLEDVAVLSEEQLQHKYEVLQNPEYYDQLIERAKATKKQIEDKLKEEKDEKKLGEMKQAISEIDNLIEDAKIKKENIKTLDFKKEQYKVYLGLPSVVKDFIYTGLNRVSIFSMLKNLVDQRELEKMGQRNWIMLAMAFLIICIAIGIGFKMFAGGMPEFTQGLANTRPASIGG